MPCGINYKHILRAGNTFVVKPWSPTASSEAGKPAMAVVFLKLRSYLFYFLYVATYS